MPTKRTKTTKSFCRAMSLFSSSSPSSTPRFLASPILLVIVGMNMLLPQSAAWLLARKSNDMVLPTRMFQQQQQVQQQQQQCTIFRPNLHVPRHLVVVAAEKINGEFVKDHNNDNDNEEEYDIPTITTTTTATRSQMLGIENNNNNNINNNAADHFPKAIKLDFVLEHHKPLGCTVDESLATEASGAKHVFVSKITEGGHAQTAGIRVGDVIIGLSGLFGDVTNVSGLGLNQVRGLVASRPEEEPLFIRVARDTNVMERHESALVDLCLTAGESEIEQCVVDYMALGYSDDSYDDDKLVDVMNGDAYAPMGSCNDDPETECLLDDLWHDWAGDIDDNNNNVNGANQASSSPVEEPRPKATVKPWSSRSSPSGTYVRDPTTGKLRNIDA